MARFREVVEAAVRVAVLAGRFLARQWPNLLLPLAVIGMLAAALWSGPIAVAVIAAVFVLAQAAIIFHFAPRHRHAVQQAALWESRAHEVRAALIAFRERAVHEDHETGLGNARQLEIDFMRAMARRKRGREQFALALLRVHHSLGREALGDNVITAVAQVILEASRDEDSVCRIGERVFAVLLAASDRPGAERFVQRVRHKANTDLFHHGGPMTFLELQGGVAACWDQLHDVKQLLAEAEADLVRFQTDYARQAGEFQAKPMQRPA
jgi:diguanylate cyclase (GGDEF)-like protein